ncbi:MAG TPA: hypothetical protein PKG65_16030, partial [Ferruginibacter sp.]|nr:hypothetical protein [Ferruginibacter sp.]
KEAILENSGFLNGLLMKDAIGVAVNKIEELGIGKRKVNYKMRDAGFSRQRYWGEPFPIVWKDDIAIPLEEKDLPLELPHVDKYGPGPNGEGPLANLADWINLPSPGGEGAGVRRETSTMPGYAGSSWYFLRYMDPHNRETFCSRKASDYWNQVDLYIGGTEHAVGHLLYSRMWTKVMYDLGLIGYDEPYKRLVNQGMIQGSSRFVHRVKSTLSYRLLNELVLTHTFNDYSFYAAGEGCFISDKLKVAVGCVPTAALRNEQNLKLLGQGFEEYKEIIIPSEYFYELYFKQREEWSKRILEVIRGQINMANDFDFDYSYFISNKYLQDLKDDEYDAIRVDVKYVDGVELNIADIKDWKTEFAKAQFILEDGKYICGVETEKMSKSKYNTVNPDDLCNKYGADTFRMYEMFLGPVEASKPWDTKGIEGVHRFLRKLWRLFNDEVKGKIWTTEKATDAELKVLHRTIKKIEEDPERFSFNTAVSTF